MKKIFALAATLPLALSLSACGGDDDGGFDESAYCDAYESAQTDLSEADLTAMNNVTFSEIKTQVVELRTASPPELEDEWNTIANAFDEFQNILEDNGLSIDDLSALGEGQLPEGVDQQTIQELGTRLQEFSESSGLSEATEAIQNDAETRCDIPAEGEPS
jgi:hypothetical protein